MSTTDRHGRRGPAARSGPDRVREQRLRSSVVATRRIFPGLERVSEASAAFPAPAAACAKSGRSRWRIYVQRLAQRSTSANIRGLADQENIMRWCIPLGRCVTGLLHSSGALASPEEDSTVQALARCLGTLSDLKPISAPSATIPPGISRRTNIVVSGVPGSHGRTFAYNGTSQRQAVCGVVLYGPASAAMKRQIKAVINAFSPRWTRQSLAAYSLGAAVTGKRTYWGDPLAPGITGVMLIERSPGKNRPTIEIDCHELSL